jgi:hypothetical protein
MICEEARCSRVIEEIIIEEDHSVHDFGDWAPAVVQW